MFLVDTDVLSALRRRGRHPQIARWFAAHRSSEMYLSVVSIGEVERGIAGVEARDPAFARQLQDWLGAVLRTYGDRILPVDLPVARRWGRLSAEAGHKGVDLAIAATALRHGLTVVTRNTRHFAATGVSVLDPAARMGVLSIPTDSASDRQSRGSKEAWAGSPGNTE